MAKSSKKTKETGAVDPALNHQNGDGPTARPAAVKGALPKPTKSKAAPKPRATKPRKERVARKARAASGPRADGGISDDQIRIRAYFIAEDRLRAGRPGTSADDWLEARRQLEEEARRGA